MIDKCSVMTKSLHRRTKVKVKIRSLWPI